MAFRNASPSIAGPPPAGVVQIARRFPRISWRDRFGTAHDTIVHKTFIVGATVPADLVLDDPAISRIHAELDPREDGLWVRDLDSLNGTIFEGQRIREIRIPIEGKSKLRLGATELVVDYDEGTEAPIELWATDRFQHLVGQSAIMRELFALLARVSVSEASLLIRGETGTGKEVIARSIHDASQRREGPYVVVDCAALPENLLDAELFGHTKGAFTGAVSARSGAIEAADGGTVFLDEIGELPMSMQPKLLRVLEQRTVRRIGETSHRPVNVRFITATHRDLIAMVARGAFREDLYFRLSVIPIYVPPLRSRREDIDLLVELFLRDGRFSDLLMERIRSQPWRGNVRELRNFVERAQALGEDRVIRTLQASVNEDGGAPLSVGTRTRETIPPPRTGLPSFADAALRRADVTPPGHINTQVMGRSDRDGRQVTRTYAFDPPPSGILPPSSEQELTPASRESTGVQAWPPERPSERMIAELSPAAISTPEMPSFEGNFKIFREQWIEWGEREYIVRQMERYGRNASAIARDAEVDRTYIYRLMRKYDL